MIVAPSRRKALKERFKKEADVFFVEAKRSMVSTTSKIPPWFMFLTLILGWNEIVMFLRNPLFFSMLFLLLAGNLPILSLMIQLNLTISGIFYLDIRIMGSYHACHESNCS